MAITSFLCLEILLRMPVTYKVIIDIATNARNVIKIADDLFKSGLLMSYAII